MPLAAALASAALPALAFNLAPRLEARWINSHELVLTAQVPSGSLELRQAADLYGQPGQGFIRLDLPGCGHSGLVGGPQLPYLSAVVDAPLGCKVEISVEPGSFVEFAAELPVLPALDPVPKLPGLVPVFKADRQLYGRDIFLPGSLGEIDDALPRAGPARGHRLVSIRLYPVQYNPSAGRIRLYTSLTASVVFKGADPAFAPDPTGPSPSPAWEQLIRRLCLASTAFDTEPYAKANDVYFDIFHGHSFQAAALRLAEWKQRLGYKVRLSDAGGWSAQAIRDSIRARQPSATYVILVSDPNAGGMDSLPASGQASSGGFPTDLYYSELDGVGYLPDLFLGRISVRTPVEAEAAVDKIISYQKGEFGSSGTAWLRRALFVAGYDASFQWLGRSTNRYCHDILIREGYSVVDTLVMASGEEQDRIVASLNQGRAWTVYTAHGSPVAWNIGGYSSFTVDEVVSLAQNLQMPALVSGHCCNSGYFLYEASDCFGEAWPKIPERGGLYYFGSIPLTYWDEDDWLQRRYFDAIYDSIPGSPGLRLAEPGRYTQYGLFWIDLNTATSLKQYYFEAYHLLGDPSLPIWTGPPGSLSVVHPEIVRPQADTMAVSVRDSASGLPVDRALVCVWSRSSPQMHRTALTGPDGLAALSLEPRPIGDTLLVTASRQGYRPCLSLALVMAKLNVSLSSRAIVVNVPTEIRLEVTDPDSGNAPVCSLEIYASLNNAVPSLVAVTGIDGRAEFTLKPDRGGVVALAGRRSGAEMFRDTIRVLAPTRPALAKAFPNPASRLVNISLELPDDCRAELSVYDVTGRKVCTLLSGILPAGYHTLFWDGGNGRGQRCPSGVYFLDLKVGSQGTAPPRRIVLIR